MDLVWSCAGVEFAHKVQLGFDFEVAEHGLGVILDGGFLDVHDPRDLTATLAAQQMRKDDSLPGRQFRDSRGLDARHTRGVHPRDAGQDDVHEFAVSRVELVTPDVPKEADCAADGRVPDGVQAVEKIIDAATRAILANRRVLVPSVIRDQLIPCPRKVLAQRECRSQRLVFGRRRVGGLAGFDPTPELLFGQPVVDHAHRDRLLCRANTIGQ